MSSATTLPSSILIREVGVREGLQGWHHPVALQQKLHLLNLVSETGLKAIEVGAFVRGDRVPQMADVDELVAGLQRSPGVEYTGLYLNEEGFLRAQATRKLDLKGWIPLALSETFLKRNINRTLEESITAIPRWEELFNRFGLQVYGFMVSTALGCNYEGPYDPARLTSLLKAALAELRGPVMEVCLADTMGWGIPELVRHSIRAVRKLVPDAEVSLHLHDTRGCGLANAYAGLLEGVKIFEASLGGIGGCPFVKGASGNVATEDLVFMAEAMGIATGVDLERLRLVVQYADKTLGLPVVGKYFKVKKS